MLLGYEPFLFENCSFVGNRNLNNQDDMSLVYLPGAAPARQHVKTKGCVFADNQTAGGGHPGFYGPVADWDITYSFSDGGVSDDFIWGKQWIPVTAENHNINGALAENDPKFVNPGAGNFRPGRKSSCLVDAGGPFEPWMGTGAKNSTQDMGDGSFTLDKVGTYGVAIIRNNAKPRRFGSAVDMGCFEYRARQGMVIMVY